MGDTFPKSPFYQLNGNQVCSSTIVRLHFSEVTYREVSHLTVVTWCTIWKVWRIYTLWNHHYSQMVNIPITLESLPVAGGDLSTHTLSLGNHWPAFCRCQLVYVLNHFIQMESCSIYFRGIWVSIIILIFIHVASLLFFFHSNIIFF